MSVIRVTCPSCQAGLKLAGELEPGATLKCPRCKKPIRMPAPEADEDEDREERASPARRRRDEEDERPRRAQKPEPEPEEEEEPRVKRPRAKQRDEEDERPRKRGKKAKQGSPALLWIGIGGGAVVLVGAIVLVVVLMGGKSDGPKGQANKDGKTKDDKTKDAGGDRDQGKKDGGKGDEKKEITISAADLLAAYRKDKKAADQRFDGKTLTVEGIVTQVDLDLSQTIYLSGDKNESSQASVSCS